MYVKYYKSIGAFLILFLVFICNSITVSAAAKGFYSGDLYYEITKKASGKTSGTVTLSSAKENSVIKTLAVPKAVTYQDKTYTVTSIAGTVRYTATGSIDGGTTAFHMVEKVSLPSTLTSIGACAFISNKSLKEIVIPNNVTTIDYMAFSRCRNLKKITLSKNLKTIKDFAFYNCKSLTSLKLPSNVSSLGFSSFSRSGLKTIKLNKNTQLGIGVFSDSVNLKTITIPADSTITKIGAGAFKGCRSLTDITLPKGLTQIPEHCFLNCIALNNIIIPSKVTEIDTDAFKDCSSLNKVTFAGSKNVKLNDGAFDTESQITFILPKGADSLKTTIEKHFIDLDIVPTIQYK